MVCSNALIDLVFSNPEIWDQGHLAYSNKSLKLKAWSYIADKLGVTAEEAKSRWTNLRDLFRRELKKSLKLAEQSGVPDAYRPRWKHYRSMLFLRDQIVKDQTTVPSYDDYPAPSLYPETILEAGDDFKYEEEGVFEEEPEEDSHSSSPTRASSKRSAPFQLPSSSKSARWSADAGYVDQRSFDNMDDDYHFVMSILPSLRNVRKERKTNFRMKVLQLIAEEEQLDAK